MITYKNLTEEQVGLILSSEDPIPSGARPKGIMAQSYIANGTLLVRLVLDFENGEQLLLELPWDAIRYMQEDAEQTATSYIADVFIDENVHPADVIDLTQRLRLVETEAQEPGPIED